MRLDKTKDYLAALSLATGNPVGLLTESINEGNLEQMGYQERIADMWSATSKAKGLCDRKPVETNGKSHRDQLLWKLPIVDILKEHLVNTI